MPLDLSPCQTEGWGNQSFASIIDEEDFSAGRPCSFGALPFFSHQVMCYVKRLAAGQLSGAVKLPEGFGDAGSGKSISYQCFTDRHLYCREKQRSINVNLWKVGKKKIRGKTPTDFLTKAREHHIYKSCSFAEKNMIYTLSIAFVEQSCWEADRPLGQGVLTLVSFLHFLR